MEQFVGARANDQLGLVVFGEHAFTQAPLTLDHRLLTTFLGRLEIGMAGDATAIGEAVGIAVKRLQQSKAKSKVIVLLSHGIGNHFDGDHLIHEILRRIDVANGGESRWITWREKALRRVQRRARGTKHARPLYGERRVFKTHNNELYGDADSLFDNAVGGNDVLTVVSTAGEENELYGDARGMFGDTVGGRFDPK